MTSFRLALALSAFAAASVGSAAEPAIRTLNVRGLTIDGTTTITVDGEDFGAAPRLLLPFPIKQELAPKATSKQATFKVAVGGDVVPGYYQLRVTSEGGVSLPIVIAVDRLPQQAFAATVDQLPAAIHGIVAGGNTV